MELRHLRYFVTVATELNFTKAAQKLRVAQPALSRQIKQLEDEIGVLLLDRTPHHVGLTPAGRAFLAEAETVLAQSRQAVEVARRTGQGTSGQLNVGYVWGLFHTLVPEVLSRFRRCHPEVAINLFEMTAIQQAEALLTGKLDLGMIGFALEADRAGLACRRVGSCEFVVVVAKEHPAARKTVVPLASLAHEFLLGISDSSFPGAAQFVKEICARAGFKPRILVTPERGFTILGMVAGRCGISLLPASLRDLPHPGVVFRPLEEHPVADMYVAWPAARQAAWGNAFVDMLAQGMQVTKPGCERS
jgi:DNA-binding transcriptional LysR family regulator